MSHPILVRSLKIALLAMLASLPALWWAAAQDAHPPHVAIAAAVGLVALIAGIVIARSEPTPGLDPARRMAARQALLIGALYLWGSTGILVSYYLTDLSWYHAYQYAAYLAVPGLISLSMVRRRLRPAAEATGQRDLDRGRTMAWLQLTAMLIVIAYILLTSEASKGLIGHEPNWAAVDIFLSGALALAGVSGAAIAADRRLRP